MLKNGITHTQCFAVFAVLALATTLMPVLTALQLRAGGMRR
jgi:hypothetical protein